MSTLSTIIQRGTSSAQPSAASVPVGTLYFQTDTNAVQRSNGASWDSYSGTASTAVVQIAQVITAGSQATVAFSTIAGIYSSLLLVWEAQDTQAGTSGVALSVKVNGDATSGNYTVSSRIGSQNAVAFSSTVAASANGFQIGGMPQSGNTNISGVGSILIPSYARTVFHKRFLIENVYDEGTANGTVVTMVARWKSTAAITDLLISTAGTAFTNGSVFTLYGIL